MQRQGVTSPLRVKFILQRYAIIPNYEADSATFFFLFFVSVNLSGLCVAVFAVSEQFAQKGCTQIADILTMEDSDF